MELLNKIKAKFSRGNKGAQTQSQPAQEQAPAQAQPQA